MKKSRNQLQRNDYSPEVTLQQDLITYLRHHHGSMCRQWFDDIEPIGVVNGVLRLLVNEPVQLRYLQRVCTEQFSEAAQAITGRLLSVHFVGSEEDRVPSATDGPSDSSAEGDEGNPLFSEEMLLSPDYSFENFVVGPGNRLAHAAAMAVAEHPGRAYNPIFIHGGVGLGKTHLLQAMCQSILNKQPSTKICYTSCSNFMDWFIDAVKAGRMNEFRSRFRTTDILVIDDIHFLAKREQTQEEFFHTFNTLYQSGRQIILSSDAPPNDIPDLEERLVSRFNCGLVARVDKPCFETRVSILQSKAELQRLELPAEVPAYVAAKVDSNVRELEGALTRVRGYAMASGQPITLQLAKSALSDDGMTSGQTNGQPSIQSIIDTVTQYYDIKLTDLLSKRRHKSIALPRQVCMWLARRHTRFSLEEIGGYFGGRDHTTVMHAVRQISSKRENDPSLANDVERIERSLLDETIV
ncbi:MAG: chromosomal replication initiator protein DnaA [Phycisphaerae bacterium]|nr:chromosomal replication initiator protein DnaA [Phycisphaerae bacterium]